MYYTRARSESPERFIFIMRFIKYTLLTLLFLLCVSVGIALLAPAIVVRPIVANYLSASGFELTSLDELSLSFKRALVARITLESSALRLTISGAELTYALPELFGGSLHAVAIDVLDVELLTQNTLPDAAAPAANSPPLSDSITKALQTLASFATTSTSQVRLPLSSLHIAEIDIHLANTSLQGELQIDTQPLRIAGTLATARYNGMLMQINANTNDASGALNGQIKLLQNTQTGVLSRAQTGAQTSWQTFTETEFTAALNTDNLQLATTAEINVAALQSLFAAHPSLSLDNTTAESLNFALALTVTKLGAEPALPQIDIQLDSTDHLLQIDYRDDARQGELQMQLPLQLTGSMAALEQSLQFSAENQIARLSMRDDDLEVQSDISLVNTDIACTLTIECTSDISLTAQLPFVRAPGVIAEDLELTTALTMISNATGFELSIPELELHNNGPSLRLLKSDTTLHFQAAANSLQLSCDAQQICSGSGAFTVNVPEVGNPTLQITGASSQGAFTLNSSTSEVSIEAPATEIAVASLISGDMSLSGTLNLTDLSAQLGSQPDVSLVLATQQLALGFADMQLVNPSINGTVRYTDDSLLTTLNLALANQLQVNLSADLGLLTATGQLDWEIPEYFFSAITPASALLANTPGKMDIVAGSVAGNGAIAVSENPAGNWQLNGPVNLNLKDISGFVEDLVFVDFDSEFRATVTDNGSIHTPAMLSAHIATLDVGLPLTDIRWNYSIDSAANTITFNDVTMNTLGGAITLANFSYNALNPDNQLTLVLTNLNLQSIVDLAEYPGIAVEGLISGYLPLSLKGQSITVDKGLIGALQPGGTIRYNAGGYESGSPVTTGNSSLDLLNQALANYHYQIMNSYVHYNENGDLRLEVQLLGNNPDLYNGQMVNLNVNIDDNIPALLRSLQASRTITDALELHLQNQQSGKDVNQ